MNILDKLDPIKREYIEVLIKEDNIIVPIDSHNSRIPYKKTINFFKGTLGYILNNETYFHYDGDFKSFLGNLRKDLHHQIKYFEDIQKILWGLILNEDIPEKYSNMLQFATDGINDIYLTKGEYLDDITKNKAKSNLYKKAIKKSKNSTLRPAQKPIFKINFEAYNLNKKITENFYGIIPDRVFYPKTGHDKIEYVNFLKTWAKFSE